MVNPVTNSALPSGDLVSHSMTRIATAANKQRKAFIVGGVVILAAALAASLYLSKRNHFRSQAAEALFRARTKLSGEMKILSDAAKPAEVKTEKNPKAAKAPALPSPSLEFSKFDVDAKLKEGIRELQKVAEEFPGTLSGFDSKMELGGLYFDHAENAAAYERALHWFESAGASASGTDQTVAALYNLGFTQEALNRYADAIKTFDRALNMGTTSFTGELLKAKARSQEKSGDQAGAQSTYDAMIKQLPSTEYAKFAETKKALR